eukprot:TRINITY_DN54155_c0_g1_i1.p1 TRINITY_DN54155_c0_g1~~TRINITY_DN54155_c0_g1_i1.p1  ORF type:complete len:220 (-),score=46.93 TRINITY_DN54155_c0_g1_i1:38-697(-)
MAFSQVGQAPTKKSSSWSLVLCFERCYKEEFAERKESLNTYARGKQGVLVCFRNAGNFQKWAYNNTKPYVLVVGWREVKPSLPAIQFRWPEAFFIVAEQDTSFDRAKPWALENGATLVKSLHAIANQLKQTVSSWKTQRALAATQSTRRFEGEEVHGRGLPKTPGPRPPESEGQRSDMMQQLFLSDWLKLSSSVKEWTSDHRKEMEARLREAMPTSYED